MIKEKRLENDLTQEELAKKLNISKGYLSKIENRRYNNLTLNLILDISKTLDIDIIKLINWLIG